VTNNPYGEAPPPGEPTPGREPHEIKGPLVALGIVLGLVATFVWMFAVFIVALSLENSTSSTSDGLVFALLILPLPLSIGLLCWRRTRQAAAGFVMGLAIGTLALAGLCSSFVVPGLWA
jgi:drug/metabolite transporter (DMT)-like permease